MSKIVGYIISLIGLVGLSAGTIPTIKTKIPGLSTISANNLMIASIIILVIGILLAMKSSNSLTQLKEVPIFKGNQVVGYRRH